MREIFRDRNFPGGVVRMFVMVLLASPALRSPCLQTLCWETSGWNPGDSVATVSWVTFLQGLGLIFVPMAIVAFATLSP